MLQALTISAVMTRGLNLQHRLWASANCSLLTMAGMSPELKAASTRAEGEHAQGGTHTPLMLSSRRSSFCSAGPSCHQQALVQTEPVRHSGTVACPSAAAHAYGASCTENKNA